MTVTTPDMYTCPASNVAQMLITISCAIAGLIPGDLVAALGVDCLLTVILALALKTCCCGGPRNGPQWGLQPPKSEKPFGSTSGHDNVRRPGTSDRSHPVRRRWNPPRATRREVARGQPAPQLAGEQPANDRRPPEPATYVSAIPGTKERGRHAIASLRIRAPRPLTPREWMAPDTPGN